jgi:uncharacterized protein YdhG (YjbR/CyaY superfamily)
MTRPTFSTIDEYIESFPDETKLILQKIRETIKKTAPDTTEGISYGIPTFYIDGKYLIYFAGFPKHVSVYPAPRSAKEFEQELANYKGGKGPVQFPLDNRRKRRVVCVETLKRYSILILLQKRMKFEQLPFSLFVKSQASISHLT